ncbi:NAD(P)H-dependent oxidoreductase [Paenibacillus segetis]|uniref:NAD(P)H dehydrogenase n=1 Tax=Paenibacillus segetis TaxID=1325360 RepID=A0ABQ1YE00_9BACL|nr:NAD(P)H-dependent oxidoreductase [Paenibacillus segetis]GGH20938.1 NAD(P)H dehydrogenase [Paenibacillus segetis]
MRVAIVYNHPYEGSYCHAILDSVKRGLYKAGHEFDLIHLDRDQFNPVMTAEDLLAFRNKKSIDSQALEYIQRIKAAEHLVFIFPIWWELMPALLKGFIDKVIFPGETYDYTSSGYGMVTLLNNLKSTTVITTMNTPSIMYKLTYGNAIKKSLIRGTLKKSGIKNVKWLSLNMVKSSSSEKRTKWLEKIEKRFTGLK